MLLTNTKLAILIFLFVAAPAILADDTKTYAGGDPQLCLSCHGANGMKPAAGILSTVHGKTGNPDGPMAKKGCQTCHGPASKHLSVYVNGKPQAPPVTFSENTPVEVQNRVCLDCHEGKTHNNWEGSAHQFAGLACASCHSIHKPQDRVLEKATQKEVCLGCHTAQRSGMHKISAHPLADGLMSCSDCHAAHGGQSDPLLVKASVNETCFQCHAEKRGPFLWEHPPVQEDCGNCHEPHGSVHKPMLKARGPWLCQQCHVAAFHPSTAYSGSGIPPNGAAQQMLAKDCLNCHSQVHGSNHPSGVRLTR